jgi:hypothetical protein
LDTVARRPMALPCLHSFCLSCINQIIVTSSRGCPHCRAPFTAEQVKSNFLLHDVVRAARQDAETAAVTVVRVPRSVLSDSDRRARSRVALRAWLSKADVAPSVCSAQSVLKVLRWALGVLDVGLWFCDDGFFVIE